MWFSVPKRDTVRIPTARVPGRQPASSTATRAALAQPDSVSSTGFGVFSEGCPARDPVVGIGVCDGRGVVGRRTRFPLRSFHAWVCDAGSAALVDVPRGEDGWATSGRLTRATRWRGLQLGSRPFDMRGRIRVICYALEVSSTLGHHHSGLHLRPSVPPRPIDVGRTFRDRQEQCRCPFRSGQSGSASCLRGWQYSSAPGQSLPRR